MDNVRVRRRRVEPTWGETAADHRFAQQTSMFKPNRYTDFSALLLARAITSAPSRERERLESWPSRFGFLLGSLAVLFATVVLSVGAIADSSYARSLPVPDPSVLEEPTLSGVNWDASLVSGPVVFWDGAAVTCRTYVPPERDQANGAFTCDWSTFDSAPATPTDRDFQDTLDIRVGIVNGARTASAYLPDGRFVDSSQPPATAG